MTVSARVLAGLALIAIVIAQFGGVDLALAGGGVGACSVGCPSPHAAPGPIVGGRASNLGNRLWSLLARWAVPSQARVIFPNFR